MRGLRISAMILVVAFAAAGTPLFAQTLNLEFSTYLGGSKTSGGGDSADRSHAIAVDSSGCAYIVGETQSIDFPTVNPYQASLNAGSWDVIVSKLASSGSDLVFSTFIGGYSTDNGYGVGLGPDKSVYIAGYTGSGNFPTTNAYQAQWNPGTTVAYTDGFVSRLSSTGSALIYSTFLGGDSYEYLEGLAIDAAGTAYVSGYTRSSNFPTYLPFQASNAGGSYDVFVTALYPEGNSVYFSTYLGTPEDERASTVGVDSSRRVYVTGYTTSASFPTLNAYQASQNAASTEAFITCFSASGSTLDYSTYLGGTSSDYGTSIAADADRCAYVVGYSYSPNFPILNAYQTSNAGSSDVFISKIASSGSALLYSSYLGGAASDEGRGVAIDSFRGACVAGTTYSSDFPTQAAYQAIFGGEQDAFLTKLSSSGSLLDYSTYLGGDGIDKGCSTAVASNAVAFLTGGTYSADFPTRNAYQASHNDPGFEKPFVARLRLVGTPPTPPPTASPTITPVPTATAIATPYLPPTPTPAPSASSTPTPLPSATPPPTPAPSPTPGPSHRCNYHTDFNGDGTSDIAIYRPSTGMWSVRNITRIYLGNSLDQPVPADYDGDGVTDFAIFRGHESLWAVKNITRVYFGLLTDFIRPGDYDGDGSADFGLYRPSQGFWAVKDITRVYFGNSTDYPVPGYYGADDVLDLALYRGSEGQWAIRNLTRVYLGSSADNPVPGDYNGDGTWEAAIFRPSNGLWRIRDFTSAYFGSSVDWRVPGDYDGNGADDIGIFRPDEGLWSVREITRVYFGSSLDTPVTR